MFGVHVAGESRNFEEGGESGDKSEGLETGGVSSLLESVLGVLVRVGGKKRSWSSLSMWSKDWRGASLVHGTVFRGGLIAIVPLWGSRLVLCTRSLNVVFKLSRFQSLVISLSR